ncbi:MAG: hypothetical protein HY777_01340 [Betaproteobacteria bacterium]|nr:hypothetical protein [Betaproteobacteria bacterium]
MAEHTQNLLKDGRASLLLRRPEPGAKLARATLLGHVRPADEAAWLDRFPQQNLPQGYRLRGIDPFGLDVMRGANRERLLFGSGPMTGEAVGAATARALALLN